jgi:tRNA modification GTPase
MYSDTIAAISTPYGQGGIGIIRISGDKAFGIAAGIFKGRKPFDLVKSHTLNYGRIVDPDSGATIDEVLVSKMEGPRTFTREDIVEINCHSGATVLKNILSLVVKRGARPAEPGEFTKRAFLNGRLDLSQAEAVIDLINAKTAEGSRAAAAQLEGRLSAGVREARERLIGLISHVGAAADYPEHDIEEITGRQVYEGICRVREKLLKLLENFDRGRIIREGVSAVIAGKPNVGKSSLLNALSGGSRAIVTDIPGTTRDIIEEYLNIRGIPVKVSDTAGIRETCDPVERIGVEKAENALREADLVIVMLDASTGIEREDEEIFQRLEEKKKIFIINKIDLADGKAVSAVEERLSGGSVIKTSLLEARGAEGVEAEIERLFLKGSIDANNEVLVTNTRHKALLDKALESIGNAARSHEGGMPLDLVAIDLKDAADHLGQITGESVGEDVVREIFARFCIGK